MFHVWGKKDTTFYFLEKLVINDTFFTFTFLPDSECLYEKYVSIVSLYMGHKANIRNNYQPHALSLQKSVRKIATQNATVVISVQMITR